MSSSRCKFCICLQSNCKVGFLQFIFVRGLINSERPEQITSNSLPQASNLDHGFPSLVWHICYWEDRLLGLVWRDYLPDVTNVGLNTNRSTIGKLSRKLFILQHDHITLLRRSDVFLSLAEFLSKLNLRQSQGYY